MDGNRLEKGKFYSMWMNGVMQYGVVLLNKSTKFNGKTYINFSLPFKWNGERFASEKRTEILTKEIELREPVIQLRRERWRREEKNSIQTTAL